MLAPNERLVPEIIISLCSCSFNALCAEYLCTCLSFLSTEQDDVVQVPSLHTESQLRQSFEVFSNCQGPTVENFLQPLKDVDKAIRF